MKKIFLILLVFLYIIPAIGVSVQAHYCGGKLASVSLTASKADSCACGSKQSKKKCCSNKTFSIKTKDSQQSPFELNPEFKAFKFQLLRTIKQKFNLQSARTVNSFYINHHPPDVVKPPLFLLNRVFRI